MKGLGQWQGFLIKNIQTPIRETLTALDNRKFGPRDTLKALRLLRDLMLLPEPTKENIREHNSGILIDIRDEFLEHLKNLSLKRVLRAIFNFAILKYDNDRFYKACVDWCFGEALRRGWRLSGNNVPSDDIWS